MKVGIGQLANQLEVGGENWWWEGTYQDVIKRESGLGPVTGPVRTRSESVRIRSPLTYSLFACCSWITVIVVAAGAKSGLSLIIIIATIINCWNPVYCSHWQVQSTQLQKDRKLDWTRPIRTGPLVVVVYVRDGKTNLNRTSCLCNTPSKYGHFEPVLKRNSPEMPELWPKQYVMAKSDII